MSWDLLPDLRRICIVVSVWVPISQYGGGGLKYKFNLVKHYLNRTQNDLKIRNLKKFGFPLTNMVGFGPINQASRKKFDDMLKALSRVAGVSAWQRDGWELRVFAWAGRAWTSRDRPKVLAPAHSAYLIPISVATVFPRRKYLITLIKLKIHGEIQGVQKPSIPRNQRTS